MFDYGSLCIALYEYLYSNYQYDLYQLQLSKKCTLPPGRVSTVNLTDRNLTTRLNEHGTIVDQPMYQHLNNCSAFNDHKMLFTLQDAANNTTTVSK